MENKVCYSYSLIAEAFEEYRPQLMSYIKCRINNVEDAEDLFQDTFLSLLDYEKLIRRDTIKSFIFTIAKNLIIDYLRRFYRKQEMTSYMMENISIQVNSSESSLLAKDLGRLERLMVLKLPLQRRQIYYMNRYLYMSSTEIATKLSLSKRTVENHLLLGRRDVREYIKKCI